jgi:hypothetical protein
MGCHTSLHPKHDEPYLKDLLDKGVVEYIDEILIYPKNQEIHDELVKEVL